MNITNPAAELDRKGEIVYNCARLILALERKVNDV